MGIKQEQALFKYCKNCKEKTEHTIHGFIENNRRYRCSKCKNEIQDRRNIW